MRTDRDTHPDNRQRAITIRLVVIAAGYFAIGLYTIYWIRTAFGYAFDYSIYYNAVRAAQSGLSVYYPFDVGGGFLYSPPVLTLFSPFVWLDRSVGLWLWLIAIIGAYAASTYVTLVLVSENQPLQQAQVLFMVALLVGFMPFWEGIHLGQINVFVVLSLVLCLYCSERQKPLLAGVFLGLAIVLKTTPLIFFIYFIFLRQFRTLVAAIIAIAVLCLITWLQFGSGVFSEFVSILPLMAGIGAIRDLNLSTNAIIFRLLSAVNLGNAANTVNLIVKAILAVLGAAILVTGIAIPAHPGEAKVLKRWLFAILHIFMVIAPPFVWFHHSTFLLVPLILLMTVPEKYAVVGAVVMFLLQSERLIFNTLIVALGNQFPNSYSLIMAFVDGTSTLVAQLILLITMIFVYLKNLQIQLKISVRGHIGA